MEPSRGGGVSYAFLQGSVAKRQQFDGILGVLVGEEAFDGLPPLSEGDTKLLWDAINFLVRVNPLFLGLKSALETCGYSFLDVNPKHLSLAKDGVNSQQHRVGTSREGVFVSVDDYDPTSHDVRVEDIVVGTESLRTGGRFGEYKCDIGLWRKPILSCILLARDTPITKCTRTTLSIR